MNIIAERFLKMSKKKGFPIYFSLFLICLNVAGDALAVRFDIPLWLDTFGTIIAGYMLGPVYGAIVGFLSHIAICIKDHEISYLYAIANMLIGIVVAEFKKRGTLNQPGGFSQCGLVITTISLFISIPSTILFKNEIIGNDWGRAVFRILDDMEFPTYLALFVGEFYVDFVDKICLMFFLYLIVLSQNIKMKHSPHRFRKVEIIDGLMVLVVIASAAMIAVYKRNPSTQLFRNTLLFKTYMLSVILLIAIWTGWLTAALLQQRELKRQQDKINLLKHKNEFIRKTILTLVRIIDARDKYTNMHSERVSKYSLMIGKKLGFDEETLECLERAAILHDIGKIGIPDEILNKQGKLTDEEYEIIKSHVILGGEILQDSDLEPAVREGALYHHEHYDGKGYQYHLKGDEIPLFERIIGVADTFDAMTSDRVYRKKRDKEYVINEFYRCRGTQFDPQICDTFLEIIKSGQVEDAFLSEEERAQYENHVQ